MNMLISCRTVSAFAASCSCNVNIMPHNIARTTQPRPQRSCNCEHRLATGPNDNATKTTDKRTKQTATVYCDSAFRSSSSSDLRTPQDTVQEAQLMLTRGSTRLAVSRGQQTWYHSTCYI